MWARRITYSGDVIFLFYTLYSSKRASHTVQGENYMIDESDIQIKSSLKLANGESYVGKTNNLGWRCHVSLLYFVWF